MNTYLILIFSIITIVLLRKVLCLFPGKYFSIQDIVTTDHNEINLFGFFLRFFLLFIFSLIIAFIYNGNIEYILLYGIYVSFLLIWPFLLYQIIYRNKKQEKHYEESKNIRMVKKYLLVYLMYSILCVFISLLSIPVYNTINKITLKTWNTIYRKFLEEYILLDLFQQSLVSSFFFFCVILIPSFIINKILNKFCKKYFR